MYFVHINCTLSFQAAMNIVILFIGNMKIDKN